MRAVNDSILKATPKTKAEPKSEASPKTNAKETALVRFEAPEQHLILGHGFLYALLLAGSSGQTRLAPCASPFPSPVYA